MDACAKEPSLECKLHTFGKDFLSDFSVVHSVRPAPACGPPAAPRVFPCVAQRENDPHGVIVLFLLVLFVSQKPVSPALALSSSLLCRRMSSLCTMERV